jgi:hypothetical protein
VSAQRDPDVPKLPRGRGMKFSLGQIVRILMVATLLVALIVLQKPCARSVSKLVTSFDDVDAAVRHIDANVDAGGVILRGDMTPAELEAAINKERGIDAGVAVDAGAADAGRPDAATAKPR